MDRTAKLWEVKNSNLKLTLRLRGVLRGHKRGIWDVKFSPVDQVLATASADATINIWSIQDLSCVKVRSCRFRVSSSRYPGRLSFVDNQTRGEVHEAHFAEIWQKWRPHIVIKVATCRLNNEDQDGTNDGVQENISSLVY